MKGLALLLSKGAPPKEGDDSEEEMGEDPKEEDKEMGLEDEHLSDAFDALKSGDKDAFLEAMKAFKEIC